MKTWKNTKSTTLLVLQHGLLFGFESSSSLSVAIENPA